MTLISRSLNRWLTPIPLFWCFFLIPGLIYVFERLGRECKRKFYAPVKSAELQSAGLLHLVLRKPAGFGFRAGQYLYLNCSDLEPYEWHPFTITYVI
jgi:respiratory burst oxidase